MAKLHAYLNHRLIVKEEVPEAKSTKDIDTVNPDVYRFGGDRYSMNSYSGKTPSDITPQQSGNYTCPRDN